MCQDGILVQSCMQNSTIAPIGVCKEAAGRMKILLVHPKQSELMVGYTTLVQPEPLALESIAAGVLDQHDVLLIDKRVDPIPLEQVFADFRPDLVCTTGYTTDVPNMMRICMAAKAWDPKVTTVVGGYHASLVPQDFDLPTVDFIVDGEGEITFKELVECLEAKDDPAKVLGILLRQGGEQVATAHRPPVKNLDLLPDPARHLVDHYRKHYHFHFWDNVYVMETGRGCPFRCNFCSVWVFHEGRYRVHRPERVVDELERMETDTVCFVDDIFMETPSYAERIADLLKARGIKKRYWSQLRSDNIVKRPDLIKKWADVGMHACLVGFEKFRQAELDNVEKWNTVANNEKAMDVLHDYNIDMWGSFIVDPQYDDDDFEELIRYVKSKRIAFPNFTILTPLPGTGLFKEKMDEIVHFNPEMFDFLHTVLPTKLPIERFYYNMARLYRETQMGFGELRRRLRDGRIPHSSLERVRGLLKSVTDSENYMKGLQTGVHDRFCEIGRNVRSHVRQEPKVIHGKLIDRVGGSTGIGHSAPSQGLSPSPMP